MTDATPRQNMGILGTLRETLTASTATDGDATADRSTGAYWCHDCAERLPEFEVDGDEAPSCPRCGESMAFERSPDSGGCAC